MFFQEERLQMASKAEIERVDIRVMAVKSGAIVFDSRTQVDGDTSRLVCTFCEWKGHDESSCCYKHGYPEWWEHMASYGGGRGSNRGTKGSRTSQQHNNDRSGSLGRARSARKLLLLFLAPIMIGLLVVRSLKMSYQA